MCFVCMLILIWLVFFLLVGVMLVVMIVVESFYLIDKVWVRIYCVVVDVMIVKFDMMLFFNLIGLSWLVGKIILVNYGFMQCSIFDDGWVYVKIVDGLWQFGVFVLIDGICVKILCIIDSVLGGGMYYVIIVIEVMFGFGGLWWFVCVLYGVCGCV